MHPSQPSKGGVFHVKQIETMMDKRRLDLDEEAHAHMVEATGLWVAGGDPRPSYAAAAACWRQAGDYGSVLRAELAERRARG